MIVKEAKVGYLKENQVGGGRIYIYLAGFLVSMHVIKRKINEKNTDRIKSSKSTKFKI